MTPPLLSRPALARVLQSLLLAELKAARAGALATNYPSSPAAWPEDLQITEGRPPSLGCDSLEILHLAGATNEMFHLSEANLDTEVFTAKTFGGWLDIIEAGWRAGIAHITFRTSGSTGAPKRCTHDFSHLQTEVRHLAGMFHSARRIVARAAPHHIYGFIFTALLPDQLGIEVASALRTDGPGQAHSFRSGDLIIAIPDQWQFLNRTLPAWPQQIDGVVSTAPCPRDLIHSLIQSGLHGMTEIYGSSETSGLATRQWPDPSYRWMPHWQPSAENPPGETHLTHTSGLQVQLMDRIHVSADGSFELAGRLDGFVQVGGTNVYPARIAALLASRPGVADASVRLMRPDEGLRMKALIVPHSSSSSEALRRELHLWIDAHLTAAERPRALTFGPAVPTDSLGTALDW